MYCRRKLLFVSLVAVLAFITPAAARAEKFALLVGVNKYSRSSARRLHGAINDVRNMRQVLEREYRFPEENITTLVDEQATLSAIRLAFKKMAQRVGSGDVFVFHFSGHGTQAPDDNGDESRDRPGDQADEALCPHDFGRNKENILRDDELGQLLNAIKARESVVILDACHSGTGTKGVPGRDKRFRVRYWDAYAEGTTRSLGGESEPFRADAAIGRDVKSVGSGRSRVVFSACTSSQQARELDHKEFRIDLTTGSLTYFLVMGLRGPADVNGDGVVTYGEAHRFARRRLDEFFNRNVADDNKRQTPLIETSPESAGLSDRPVFASTKKMPMYAQVTWKSEKAVTLDLGGIHGVKPKQRFGLYIEQSDLTNLESQVGIIQVTDVGMETAEAQMVEGTRRPRMVAMPIVDPLASPDIRLLTEAASRGGERSDEARLFVRELNASLAGLPRVRIDSPKYDLRVTVSQKQLAVDFHRITFRIADALGREYASKSFDLQLSLTSKDQSRVRNEMATQIKSFVAEMRNRDRLASITNPRPGFGLQAVVNRRPGAGKTLPEYRPGQGVTFGLKSTAFCWYYAVIIDPQGKPKLWYPIEQEWNENRLPASTAITYPTNGATLPLEGREGVYTVKVFATRNQLPRSAFADGLPRAEVFREIGHKDWTETSVGIRLLGEEQE